MPKTSSPHSSGPKAYRSNFNHRNITMKNHRSAALAALAAAAPRGLASNVRGEASPSELISQMKASLDATLQANSTKFSALEKTMAELNAALDTKTKDVVSQARVDAINASIDSQILELKASTAGIAMPAPSANA